MVLLCRLYDGLIICRKPPVVRMADDYDMGVFGSADIGGGILFYGTRRKRIGSTR